jgi:hypothetical protein
MFAKHQTPTPSGSWEIPLGPHKPKRSWRNALERVDVRLATAIQRIVVAWRMDLEIHSLGLAFPKQSQIARKEVHSCSLFVKRSHVCVSFLLPDFTYVHGFYFENQIGAKMSYEWRVVSDEGRESGAATSYEGEEMNQ